jgi:hypothetical protein
MSSHDHFEDTCQDEDDRICTYPESDRTLVRYDSSSNQQIDSNRNHGTTLTDSAIVLAYLDNLTNPLTPETTNLLQDESETQLPIPRADTFTTPTRPTFATPSRPIPQSHSPEAELLLSCDKCRSTEFTKQCFAPECTKTRCAQCVVKLCTKNKTELVKDDDGDLIHVCTKVSLFLIVCCAFQMVISSLISNLYY